jgi:dihydroxyacetone kinase-like predicted kinase
VAGLEHIDADESSLITLYRGGGVGDIEAEALGTVAAETVPGAEIETVSGGQALYPVIASVE